MKMVEKEGMRVGKPAVHKSHYDSPLPVLCLSTSHIILPLWPAMGCSNLQPQPRLIAQFFWDFRNREIKTNSVLVSWQAAVCCLRQPLVLLNAGLGAGSWVGLGWAGLGCWKLEIQNIFTAEQELCNHLYYLPCTGGDVRPRGKMGALQWHDYTCYLRSNITWLWLPLSMEGKRKLIEF